MSQGGGNSSTGGGGAEAVTSAATIPDEEIVRGDGGARGVQGSAITIDDTRNIRNAASLNIDPGVSGDPIVQFNINTTPEFVMGVDDNDSDSFKISQGFALGTNDTFVMTDTGQRTLPLQSRFVAFVSSNINDVTGDGTSYTVVFDTEDQDVGADYDDTTGIYTAPVAGTYIFTTSISVNDLGVANTAGLWSIRVAGSKSREFRFAQADFGNVRTNGNNYAAAGSFIMNLAAADTVFVTVQVNSGTLIVDIVGAAGGISYFTGALLC